MNDFNFDEVKTFVNSDKEINNDPLDFLFPLKESDLKKHTLLSKDELIQNAIENNLTESKNFAIAKTEFLCQGCDLEKICKYAWDAYNISDDNNCLASK